VLMHDSAQIPLRSVLLYLNATSPNDNIVIVKKHLLTIQDCRDAEQLPRHIIDGPVVRYEEVGNVLGSLEDRPAFLVLCAIPL
jgi:hypothetical protein